jgi:hypothetical protein
MCQYSKFMKKAREATGHFSAANVKGKQHVSQDAGGCKGELLARWQE